MEVGQRFELEGVRNMRDFGGYESENGRHVAYGKLLRTDALGMLTSSDIKKLVDTFHPSYDIDLRSHEEVLVFPDVNIPDCTYLRLSMHGDSGASMIDHHTELNLSNHSLDRLIDFIYLMDEGGDIDRAMQNSAMVCVTDPIAIESEKKILDIMLSNENGAIIIHCKDGKDRTGFVSAMILELLGVDRSDVFEDYLKTNECMKVKFERRREQFKDEPLTPYLYEGLIALAGVRKCWLERALDHIDQTYGGMQGYAREKLGMTDESIKELKDKYLI